MGATKRTRPPAVPFRRNRRGPVAALATVAALLAVLGGTATAGARPAAADIWVRHVTHADQAQGTSTWIVNLVVGNDGPDPVGALELRVAIPAGVTVVTPTGWYQPCTDGADGSVVCSFGALAPGDRTATSLVVANTGLAPGSSAELVAAVGSDTDDPDPADNFAAIPLTFAGGPLAPDRTDLTVTSYPEPGPPPWADPSTGSPSLVASHVITTNVALAPATGVTVTYTVPAGVALFLGQSWWSGPEEGGQPTCSVDVDRRRARCSLSGELAMFGSVASRVLVVNAGLAAGSTTELVVDATSTTTEANPADNHLVVPVTFAGGPVPLDEADLAVTAAANPRPGPPGEAASSVVTVGVTARNHSPLPATGVVVTLQVPAGARLVPHLRTWDGPQRPQLSCATGDGGRRLVCTWPAPIVHGEPLGFEVAVVNTGFPAGSAVPLTVEATETERDADPADNTVVVPVVVAGGPVPTIEGVPTAQLTLVPTGPYDYGAVSGGTAAPAPRVEFAWRVVSAGPDTTSRLSVDVHLGPGLVLESGSVSAFGAVCEARPPDSRLTCSLDVALAAGEDAYVRVIASYDGVEAGTTPWAEAFVAGNLPDPVPGDNHSLETMAGPVVPAARGTAPTLPATGRPVGGLALTAVLLVTVGAALMAASRRRPIAHRAGRHVSIERCCCPATSSSAATPWRRSPRSWRS